MALQLKAGTTVDSTGTSPPDVGYTAEMKVDLKGLGYPPGLGDHTIFFGCALYDQDRFGNPLSDSYGTRTWFFREREGQCCPAWTLLDGTFIVGPTTGVEDGPVAAGFAALGNPPNPFRLMTTLGFNLAVRRASGSRCSICRGAWFSSRISVASPPATRPRRCSCRRSRRGCTCTG